jgi:hypothetical protein
MLRWMAPPVSNTVDPMASQMAQLLAGSDVDELREIVKRWVAEAPTEGQKKHYREFGSRLLELKEALKDSPVPPSRDELEAALTMMLRLAAQSDGSAPRR